MPTPRRMMAHPKDDAGVVLAAVVGAHGIAGEVRLKVFAEDLSPHKSFNDGALTLTSLRTGSNGAIARFSEVRDRTAAEALRGTTLSVPRSALPPDPPALRTWSRTPRASRPSGPPTRPGRRWCA